MRGDKLQTAIKAGSVSNRNGVTELEADTPAEALIHAERAQPSKFGRPGAALVVITQVSNEQGVVRDPIDDSVLIVDPSSQAFSDERSFKTL